MAGTPLGPGSAKVFAGFAAAFWGDTAGTVLCGSLAVVRMLISLASFAEMTFSRVHGPDSRLCQH